MKRSKKYKNAFSESKQTPISLEEAVSQVKKNSTSKFPGKIDLHIALLKSQKKEESNQVLRINITLPHSLGTENRVIVFAEKPDVEKAKKAGAIEAGGDELIKKIEEGWLDFDVAISTTSMMPKIAKLGRVLGTRGLMPNPKMGTVTDNIEKSVKEFKSGKLAAKSDAGGAIHLTVGTMKMDDKEIKENTEAALKEILTQTGKSSYQIAFKSVHLAPTMGPSVKVLL